MQRKQLCATRCAHIYMVERLVLASPKGIAVNILRMSIGFLMAVLGASAVDLVIFEREVAQQLREVGETRIKSEYDLSISKQIDATALAKTRHGRRIQPRALGEGVYRPVPLD